MDSEKQIEDLKRAVGDFNTGLELAMEANDKLQLAVAVLPMDPDRRDEYLKIIDDDMSIAICVFIMLKTAKRFPAKFAVREIMVEMSRNFSAILGFNFMANAGRFKDCPVHGPNCPEKESHAAAAAEDFPQHVDEDLKPITAEIRP